MMDGDKLKEFRWSTTPEDNHFFRSYRLPTYAETISAQARDLLVKHEVTNATNSQYRFLITKHAYRNIKKKKDQDGKLAYIYGIPVCIVKEDNAPAIRLVKVLG